MALLGSTVLGGWARFERIRGWVAEHLRRWAVADAQQRESERIMLASGIVDDRGIGWDIG